MRHFFIICLTSLFFQVQAQDFIDTTSIDSADYFFASSDVDYIPGEANYDLIQDRLQCIENIIPLHFNETVYSFINYFTIRNRDYTRLMLKRQHLYFPIFEKYLKKYDLPDELKYLSIIESGLNPKATSWAKAVGLWQFMPLTGRSFNLHQDWYIDERMDPEKSTEAACRYLKQLYVMFDDWGLAIAAYNTGPGNVRKAIRRSGYKKSFWGIYPHLYRETRSYLPQLVAMIYTMNYADEHNLYEDDPEFMPVSDTIIVNDYVHMKTLANQLGLCADDLQELNPGLIRNAVPDNIKNYSLRIPYDVKELLEENRLAILDSAGKVGKEQLEHLAKNSLGSTYGRDKIVYRVKSGDVLGTIANRYNVRILDIKKWNNLNSNLIRVGQPLNIWLNGSVATSASSQPLPSSKMYVVQPGDTLWDISRKYEGITIEKIKELNNLSDTNIKPGQKLKLG
jgi:membrane-bound lytic murein transglycosylase D